MRNVLIFIGGLAVGALGCFYFMSTSCNVQSSNEDISNSGKIVPVIDKTTPSAPKLKTKKTKTEVKAKVEIKPKSVAKATSKIEEAQFTTRVKDKKPIDEIKGSIFLGAAKRISFFTNIVNQKGKKISHIWMQNKNEVFRKTFDVAGDKWRVHTNIGIKYKYRAGDKIIVIVQDEDKNILAKKELVVKP